MGVLSSAREPKIATEKCCFVVFLESFTRSQGVRTSLLYSLLWKTINWVLEFYYIIDFEQVNVSWKS